MTDPDPVFACLADLPAIDPSPELSARLRAAAHARLRPRHVHPAWTLLVAAAVVGYLGWAMHFSGNLYGSGKPTSLGRSLLTRSD
ncbi:MAG: hypothetical protein ABSC94_28240 [Polyangiaceae bacterium]|jgi:hypothetical protein